MAESFFKKDRKMLQRVRTKAITAAFSIFSTAVVMATPVLAASENPHHQPSTDAVIDLAAQRAAGKFNII